MGEQDSLFKQKEELAQLRSEEDIVPRVPQGRC